MVAMTHTLLEVADCNTTLHYLQAGSAADPLLLASEDDYNALYEQVGAASRKFEELAGKPGTVINQLRGVYSRNKFWRKYLRSSDIDSYPETAWENVLPIAATLTEKVEVVLPDGFGLQVSPAFRVLIYPFGWSTWLSFRIVGDHDLAKLASLTQHLITKQAYRLESSPHDVITLTDLFNRVNKGVREDAFGGKKAKPVNPQELLIVMTVLAKHGGSPSLGALTPDQDVALKTILRPEGPIRPEPVTTFATPLSYGSPSLDFVLHDAQSWFLWAEHLLKPEGRNFNRLRCFHNNMFRSLQQAWVLHNFLMQAIATKDWSPALRDLVERIILLLNSPGGIGGYKNKSLITFLERAEFQASIDAAQKRFAPPGKS